MVEQTVPAAHRKPLGKGEVALALLDDVMADGRATPSAVAAEPGYEAAPGWDASLRGRGLAPATDPGRWLVVALVDFVALRRNFGLDHFEGRTWVGWHHHVALVMAAYTFRVTAVTGRATRPRAEAGDRSWRG